MINEALKLITSNKTSTPVHNKNSVIIEINDFTKAIKLGTSTWTIPVSYTHLPSPRDRTRSRMPSSA